MAKSPTICDIAARVGVSHTAVSMALRGAPGVSENRRIEIRRIAREMNYYPQAAGQMLASKKTGQLGLIVASRDSVAAFAAGDSRSMIGQFIQACTQRQMRYMIEFHHHEADRDGFTPPHMVAGKLVDGVLAVSDVGEPLRNWLDEEADIPWVSVREPARHCVLSDNEQAVFAMTKRLVELGHRRIALEVGPQRYMAHRLSLAGFTRAAQTFDLPVDLADPQWVHIHQANELSIQAAAQARMDWARLMLRKPDRPTAVMCASSSRMFVHAALELGMRVPDDLSLADWTTPEAAQSHVPATASIDTDFKTMVNTAMGMLDQLIEGSEVDPPVRRIMPCLDEGATMVCVPENIKTQLQ